MSSVGVSVGHELTAGVGVGRTTSGPGRPCSCSVLDRCSAREAAVALDVATIMALRTSSSKPVGRRALFVAVGGRKIICKFDVAPGRRSGPHGRKRTGPGAMDIYGIQT